MSSSSSSSSSLRQHQRKTASTATTPIVATGHTPLARNHSAGASMRLQSSSITTQRSHTSLSLTTTPTTTTATATSNAGPMDNNGHLNEKNLINIFHFDPPLGPFHESSLTPKTPESVVPRSTRLLCGSIIPLQTSKSSPNIDHRSIETDLPSSPLLSPALPLRRPELRYRSSISLRLLASLCNVVLLSFVRSNLEISDGMVFASLN